MIKLLVRVKNSTRVRFEREQPYIQVESIRTDPPQKVKTVLAFTYNDDVLFVTTLHSHRKALCQCARRELGGTCC